jgi:hypothetical protein
MTLEQWKKFERDFVTVSGGAPQFYDLKATWYKDPPNAQGPGIYAAFDYSCKYENIKICSGVIILYSQTGSEFHVMRHERNYIYKETESERLKQGKLPLSIKSEPQQSY